jgi:triosephosphate isomerase
MDRVLIAYEPIWAQGHRQNATPVMAQEVHAVIRKLLKENLMKQSLLKFLLYGGSMKPDNAQGLLNEPDIDGASSVEPL